MQAPPIEEEVLRLDANLPLEVQELLQSQLHLNVASYKVSRDNIGNSSDLYILKPKGNLEYAEISGLIVKVPRGLPSSRSHLREAKVLRWLSSIGSDFLTPRIPPLIYPQTNHNNGSHINVLGLLPGVNGAVAFAECTSHIERIDLIIAFGRAARALHDIPVELYDRTHAAPPSLVRGTSSWNRSNPLNTETRAWYSMEMDNYYRPLVTSLIAKLGSSDPAAMEAAGWLKIFEEALLLPSSDDLWGSQIQRIALVHGDFCLPNVLFKRNSEDGQWELTGIVDWAETHFSDIRYDLCMGLWTIDFNCKLIGLGEFRHELKTAFLSAYFDSEHEILSCNEHASWYTLWRAMYELYYFLADAEDPSSMLMSEM